MGYLRNYHCDGTCVQSCGFVHFSAFGDLRVYRYAKKMLLWEDDCSLQVPMPCIPIGGPIPVTRLYDSALHPGITCISPGCTHVEVDGQNGEGGSAIVGLTINTPCPESWPTPCPPFPPLPVSMNGLVNAVDVEFDYTAAAIPRYWKSTPTPLAITIRVNPDTVILGAAEPPRPSGIGADDMSWNRAVVVRVVDPNMSNYIGSTWWGCYLWTDLREGC